MSTCVLCRRLQPPKRKQNGGSVIPTRRLLYEHYVVLFHLSQGFVALVAPLGVLLGGDEEFFGLLGAPRRGTEHLIIKIKCSEEGLFSIFSPGAFFVATERNAKLRYEGYKKLSEM